jgi:hypothetical protein
MRASIRDAVLSGPMLVAVLAASNPASGQQSIMIDGVRPEVHLGIGWHGEIGVGARADIPLAPRGFIDGVDDEFALSPGAELYFDTDGGGSDIAIAGVLAAQWNFYVSPEWSAFPEAGLALIFRDRDRGPFRDDELDVDLLPHVGAGARWHWSRRNALVMRLCWPFGLQIGLTF